MSHLMRQSTKALVRFITQSDQVTCKLDRSVVVSRVYSEVGNIIYVKPVWILLAKFLEVLS